MAKLPIRISAGAADCSELLVIILSIAVHNTSNTLKFYKIFNIFSDYSQSESHLEL